MGAKDDLAAIFAQFGTKPPEELPDDIERAMDESAEQTRVEGEWVLYSLKYPLSPRITKKCARCGAKFQTNYQGLAHCSNRCVIEELRDKFGLEWRPANRRDKERWEPRVPAATIPLDALRAMKRLVAQAEADLQEPLEIGEPPESFVLKREFRGPQTRVSESDYALPGSSSPSLASEQQQEDRSRSQEASVQEDTSPESPQEPDDPFAFLYAD